MRFILLHSAVPGDERRYDGPIPRRDPPPMAGASAVLERLAAESRAQTARRRQRINAVQVLEDGALSQRSRSLNDYRRQAMAVRNAGKINGAPA
ncbi:hypothetical protein [Magnetospirillum sulfuroxidans]|uniref:Uncharacterized protein n=1 Tax=Magnetospirillum sulfuroxidans TaxID=611300 RepID=A0ABS5IBV2_9PROT|nr:hypothetical protein [Magnetospirillum sulfuroxidans]MBR9971794.1 hypothetical protein [Magnetospirillum sulfuroxidans]